MAKLANKPLYAIGEPVREAYLISSGPVFVQIGDWEVASLLPTAKNILVGTEDYLVHGYHQMRKRNFSVAVSREASVTPVPFETVDASIEKYDFGFSVNVFLAQLIEYTNRLYRAHFKDQQEALRRYELRAKLYARFVNELMKLFFQGISEELKVICDSAKELPLYENGSRLLEREQLSKLPLSPDKDRKFVKSFSKGMVICREGEPADALFALLQGKVGVSVGDLQIATIEEAGEGFGELSLFLDGKRTATLTAVTDADLYVIKKGDLKSFHRTHSDVFLNIGATLADRIGNNVDLLKQTRGQGKAADRANTLLKDGGRDELKALIDKIRTIKSRLNNSHLSELYDKFYHLTTL